MALAVCMIIDYFFPDVGGAQTHTLALSRTLRKKGVDAFVVTRQLPGCQRVDEVEGVPVYRVGKDGSESKALRSISFTAGALQELARQRRRFQIIHSHKVISPATVGLVARDLLGKKLVIQPHSSSKAGALHDMLYRRPVHGPLRLQWMRRRADRFLAISHQVVADLKLFGVPERKIAFIPNGVDVDTFSPFTASQSLAARTSLGLTQQPVVTFVGRLDEVKQLDVLLRAWVTVSDRRPDAKLLLVGDGPERARLERLVEELGLAASVLFCGAATDVRRFLTMTDVFVMPSRAESFGLALTEAMACGIACIASRVGGMLDIVDPGVNGLFFSVGNQHELAAGLIELLSSGELRERLGRAARADVQRRFSLSTTADSLIAVYGQLLEAA